MMNCTVFFICFVVSFGAMIMIEVLFGMKWKKWSGKIEQNLMRCYYVYFYSFLVACFSIILQQYNMINQLLCSIIWILILAVGNRVASHKLVGNDDTNINLAMLLSAIYFVMKSIFENSIEYLEMFWIVISLIVGCFVPLDELLSNDSVCYKVKAIIKNTHLKEIKKNTWLGFGFTMVCFVVCFILYETQFYKKYGALMDLGFIVGVLAALPLMDSISRKNAKVL